MRPWIQRTLLGLFGGAIALGALTACGHHERHPGPSASAEEQSRWRDKMVDRVARKLELNEAQKQKLAALAAKLHEQRNAMRGATDPRTEVRALVAGEKFDRARAQALVAEKTAAIQARSPEVIAALGDFYDSLTPAQQAQVRDFMQHRHGWWRRG
jgi:Spy/CpxP family protein refolding chaperone